MNRKKDRKKQAILARSRRDWQSVRLLKKSRKGELASLWHSWGTAVSQNWNSNYYINFQREEIVLHSGQSARTYLWRSDKTARSSLNSVVTLPPFPNLMIVWLLYFLSHFNLLYLNSLNYSSYSDIRAYSAVQLYASMLRCSDSPACSAYSNAQICEYAQPLCWGSYSTSLSSVDALSGWGN